VSYSQTTTACLQCHSPVADRRHLRYDDRRNLVAPRTRTAQKIQRCAGMTNVLSFFPNSILFWFPVDYLILISIASNNYILNIWKPTVSTQKLPSWKVTRHVAKILNYLTITSCLIGGPESKEVHYALSNEPKMNIVRCPEAPLKGAQTRKTAVFRLKLDYTWRFFVWILSATNL